MRVYSATLKGASAVIAQTEQQQDTLLDRFSIDSTVVTNAYDLPPGEKLVPHANREGVLWVGSSDPNQKKPERFLRLASSLPDESFKMISAPPVRDNGFHEELQRKAKKIANLSFIGEVPPEEIHEYYRDVKILVNTSEYEGFPNTFLEAWRYETPVISLKFDIDDLLSTSDAGIKSGDMDQLKQDVQLLTNDTNLRARMGSTSRSLVEQRYSLKEITTEYENIFKKISER
jgi:glycosyltransferase involved in cell wall biosynthesis